MSSPVSTLTITRPDDWHLHLRDGAELASVLGYTARAFARAIVMPNLRPPVTTVKQAARYRDRIRAALPAGMSFEPLMTLYLTDTTSPAEIDRAAASGFVAGVKLYPAGATTHSDAGVTSLARCAAAFERMEERDVVLQVHGEATGDDVDPYDRESVFIERELAPLVARHPGLRVVLEHVTTRAGVEFVRAGAGKVAATITPQHLLYNRGAMFRGGLRPHLYCLPILKRERDREALVAAAIAGDPRFFLGTDSAPHERYAKETACGCAGVFSAPAALELYARAFEEAGRLDRLESFSSFNGADFYRLPRNQGRVTLERRAWTVPESLPFGAGEIVPMCAGETLAWQLRDAGGAP
ncbi:MAG: dihydroorotase [Gammaproteobacteria bacterium]|nr:dihydroorotase [Gammaproteobacteria bacterium]